MFAFGNNRFIKVTVQILRWKFGKFVARRLNTHKAIVIGVANTKGAEANKKLDETDMPVCRFFVNAYKAPLANGSFFIVKNFFGDWYK